MKMSGLWIPLVTPMFQGDFDEISAKKLVESTQDNADGYVVGLSTGEGETLPESLWSKAMKTVVSATDKPVAAGILGKDLETTVRLSKVAKDLGCSAVVVSANGNSNEVVNFFTHLNTQASLPVVFYNTEKNAILEISHLKQLDKLSNLVAIKDSSGNETFFKEMLAAKKNLRISVLQGLENKLLQSKGCDGYLISLGNVEPQLCKQMFDDPAKETNQKILQKFWEYNLGGKDWYISLKAILYSRGILRSSEQVQQTLKV